MLPVADLHAKGLLSQTLVVLPTEFGSQPRINGNGSATMCLHSRSRVCWLGLGSRADRRGGTPWATHSDNFEGTPRQAAILDQTMSTLFANLQAKGCWTRCWWSWARSSVGHPGSTTTTGGTATTKWSHACWLGRGLRADRWMGRWMGWGVWLRRSHPRELRHPQRQLRGDLTSGDESPAGRLPCQGAAGPDAGGTGHRVRTPPPGSTTGVQRNLRVPAGRGGDQVWMAGTPTATTSRGSDGRGANGSPCRIRRMRGFGRTP